MMRYSTAARKDWARYDRAKRLNDAISRYLPLGMTLRLSPGQATQMLDAIFNGTGINVDSFILEIRSGAQPATADLAPTGTVLSTITLPADAFSAAANPAATVSKAGTWSDPSADANGTAGWARLRASGDAGTTNNTDRRFDFNVTATGGGGEIEVQNTSFAVGQVITVNTAVFTQPK